MKGIYEKVSKHLNKLCEEDVGRTADKFHELKCVFVEADVEKMLEVLEQWEIGKLGEEAGDAWGGLYCREVALREFFYECESWYVYEKSLTSHIWGIGFWKLVEDVGKDLAPKTPEERYELIKFWNRSLDALDVIRNTKSFIKMKTEVERLCPGLSNSLVTREDYQNRFWILMFAAAEELF